jgi:CarD family transcriptional regulator
MAARKTKSKVAKTKVAKSAVKKSKPKAKPSRAKNTAKGSVVRGLAKPKSASAKAAGKGAGGKTAGKKSAKPASVTRRGKSAVRAAKPARGKTVKAAVAVHAAKEAASAPKNTANMQKSAAGVQMDAAKKEIASPAAKAAAVTTAPERSTPVTKNIAGSGPDRDPPLATAQKPPVAKTVPTAAKPEKDEQNGEQKAMKTNGNRHGFKLSEFVVYPAHGVGQIVSIEEQEVAGFKLELFVINFVKDKMTLRVPTAKVTGVGMRKLSDPEAARRSLEILTGRARVKRTMWSRRAQEYESKINSGDINAIAEVVRDLFRSDAQPEQSYSERQLYEAALDRMMREIAAVHKLTETEALKMIETQLKKNIKRAPKAETVEGEVEAEEADVEEAA